MSHAKRRQAKTGRQSNGIDSPDVLMDDGAEDGNGEEWHGIESMDAKVREEGERHVESERKLPTRDELRSIKEASELFKSSSFKLQVDALLPNVRPKESRVIPLDEFLRLMYTTLMDLPSKPPVHPLEASHTAWKVAFEKPNDITLVGSWANRIGVKSASSVSWTIDIAVEMPATLFQEKDYLDCRFFHKRAHYLASLASAISLNEKLNVDVFYDSPTSNDRLTSLVLMPRKDGSSTDFTSLNARVRLLPVLPTPSPVSLHHLSSTRCNLRVKSFGDTKDASPCATPIYNSDLFICTTPRIHLLHTHEFIQEVPSFVDALALLRVWANQRGYSPGPKDKGCVIGFEDKGFFWTALIRFLFVGEDDFGQKMSKGTSRKTVGRGLSSYQLFRAALDFLAKHDFSTNAVFSRGGSKFPPETYNPQNESVFVDSASINVLAGVPQTSLDLLRHDAKITLDSLNKSTPATVIDPFAELFLQDRRQLSTRFDVVLGVSVGKVNLRRSHLIEALDSGSPSKYVLSKLASILRRALGDRVHAIGIFSPTIEAWPISYDHTNALLNDIHIGLILNPRNAFRLVDHGPAASEQDGQEAIDFRDFWGSKAELRRFKDGRIIESVVWEVRNSDERIRIPSSIVRFVLTRHFGFDAETDIRSYQKDFDDLLRVPDSLSQQLFFPGMQPGFKNAMAAFDTLVRSLKGLDEVIPLAILNVSPTSSDLRYTSIFAPIPMPPKNVVCLSSTMRYLPSMEIILQFERSGRWPDDLSAIQKMKLAFFERIASSLMNKISGLNAVVVTGDERAFNNSDSAYLEIVTPDGWAFSARIWHDREATLFDRLLGKKRTFVTNSAVSRTEGDMADLSSRQSMTDAFRFYKQRYIHAPKHHRAIANLCHRYPAYAGTARLVKRWLASHWVFEGHVSGEAIELLCAFIFVDGKDVLQQNEESCAGTPATKELGFFRVISFLKDWAWEFGLFVPVYETKSSTAEGDSAVHVKADSGKGVWTITTSEDREGKLWTSEGPDALVARRIRTLASSCMSHVLSHESRNLTPKASSNFNHFDTHLINMNCIQALFIHPSNDYDILIRLKPDTLCRAHQSIITPDIARRSDKKYANIPSLSSHNDQPMRVSFDPVLMYYNDLKVNGWSLRYIKITDVVSSCLQRVFAGSLEFFFDSFGGSVIGAVWDPTLSSAKPFRVLADYSSIPLTGKEKSSEKGQVMLNRESVLAEIQRLGDGLVEAIEEQRVPA
ncbi:hypothetical protein EW145_g4591 [Phellinidium pouzarii]|uniref:U3 small nucleolar RNA-associated protein 22 n=1 Tax=Phellinidium pouzarii TaxID=167371 RepID=A0A4S4L4S2_9AGAM|nr:hypothetical protein EW145_g4591 [Phellinidium pouzarii]